VNDEKASANYSVGMAQTHQWQEHGSEGTHFKAW